MHVQQRTQEQHSEQAAKDGHVSGNMDSRPTRRKRRQAQDVLNRGRSTLVRDIRTTLTLKYNQIFLVTSHTGDIRGDAHGLGVYFRDTEYLDEIVLKLNGQECLSVLANGVRGNEGQFELANLDLRLANGEELERERISIKRSYIMGDRVTQIVRARNMAMHPVELELTLTFGSHFEDMMVVRGHEPGKRGTIRPPRAEHGRLILAYDGADRHTRTVTITFDPPPQRIEGTTACWPLALGVKEETTIRTTIELADDGPPSPWERREGERHHAVPSATVRHQQFVEELAQLPTIHTSNSIFDLALDRSFRDIQMLATADHGDVYIAGGIPWYATLFGRDSCTCAFQVAPFKPELSNTTLETLARYQGREVNDFRDEAPGKIPHELRHGQMANLEEIPQVPYYGTVDATPWFLMVLAEYIRWSGDTRLFEAMQRHIKAALDWIDSNPTRHHHERGGFLWYGTRSEHGLRNQGWKDSGNAIVNEDGSNCEPPIALAEVQGYAYRAQREMADLYRLHGEHRAAKALDEQARRRRAAFNERFWLADQGYFALCLQRDDRPSRAISSNGAQTLFTRIVDEEKAARLCQRLMCPDLFAGWGIRTLSAQECAYNPQDYQVGAFWPHDNSLIMLGLWEYGFDEAAERIFTGMFEAARWFDLYRLPECFAGFGRDEFDAPVRYPVACIPQAWSAGALPLMLRTALGLSGRAFERRLLIRHPHLPRWLERVTVEGLRVGQATVDLEYRLVNGRTAVVVTRRDGQLTVDVEY